MTGDQFLPRDVMHSTAMSSCGDRLSVGLRLIRSCIVLKRVNTPLNFHHLAPHRCSVFYQTLWQFSDGRSPSRGIECRWGMKDRNFYQ